MTKNKAFSRRGHHRLPPVARPRAPQAPVVKQTEELRSQKKCTVRRSSQRELCSSSRSNKPYTKRLQDGLKQVVRLLLLKKPARRTEAHQDRRSSRDRQKLTRLRPPRLGLSLGRTAGRRPPPKRLGPPVCLAPVSGGPHDATPRHITLSKLFDYTFVHITLLGVLYIGLSCWPMVL